MILNGAPRHWNETPDHVICAYVCVRAFVWQINGAYIVDIRVNSVINKMAIFVLHSTTTHTQSSSVGMDFMCAVFIIMTEETETERELCIR